MSELKHPHVFALIPFKAGPDGRDPDCERAVAAFLVAHEATHLMQTPQLIQPMTAGPWAIYCSATLPSYLDKQTVVQEQLQRSSALRNAAWNREQQEGPRVVGATPAGPRSLQR